MNLFLIKRDHHEGQSIYGVYESEAKAFKRIDELCKLYSRIKKFEYEILKIKLNESIIIEND